MRKIIIWIVVITLIASVVIPGAMVFFNPSVSAPSNTYTGALISSGSMSTGLTSTGIRTNTGM